MQSHEQQQKRQFSVPSRDELIQQIKDLDEEVEHIALNLIKCDFNATENDIKKTFPEFQFVKVKNYNPGSFEVIFEMRIDAINFIRNHYDKKILSRRFFIKMGRQQKQVIQNWTGVGNAQRQFKGSNRPQFNRNQPQGQIRTKKPEDHTEGEKASEQTKPETTETEAKQQVKQVVQTQEPAVKKQGKIIPKTETYKKPQYKKPVHHEVEKKTEGHVKKQETQHAVKKEQHHATKKTEDHPVKKEQTHQAVKKQQPHQVAKTHVAKGEKQVPKEVKKVEPKKEEKKPAQKAPEQAEKKQEDDGWITVPSKAQKRR